MSQLTGGPPSLESMIGAGGAGTGGGSIVGQEKPLSAVNQRLAELNSNLNALEGTVNTLEKALNEAMCSNPDPESDKAKPEIAIECAIATAINGCAETLKLLTHRINDLIGRLEV